MFQTRSKRAKVVALLCACFLGVTFATSCQGSAATDKDTDEFYTVKVYMPFNAADVPRDLKKVNDELNKMTRELINADIDIIGFNFQEYRTRVSNAVASNVPMDLIWVNAESYYFYIEQEALYPLDNLLADVGQATWNDLSAGLWEQVRTTDGKIYAAPNLQILPRTAGITMNDESLFTAFLEQQGLDESKISEMSLEGKLQVLEDYMAHLKMEKLGFGGLTYGFELPYYLESFAGFDDLSMGMGVPGVVRAGETTVINQFESAEFTTLINTLSEWYQKGYVPKDIQQGSYDSSNLDVLPTRTWKPDDRVKRMAGGKEKFRTTFRFGEPHYLQSYILGTMWSISSTSDLPARAMKFVNLMHTNADVHNLLKLGIEGVHYNLINDGKQAKPILNSGYENDLARWTLGNELIGLPLDSQSPDIFERVREINENTALTPVIGFHFDRTPVMTEIQVCSSISAEYFGLLNTGMHLSQNPQIYQEFLDKLNEAGAQKIIDEKQRQLNEWLKNQ